MPRENDYTVKLNKVTGDKWIAIDKQTFDTAQKNPNKNLYPVSGIGIPYSELSKEVFYCIDSNNPRQSLSTFFSKMQHVEQKINHTFGPVLPSKYVYKIEKSFFELKDTLFFDKLEVCLVGTLTFKSTSSKSVGFTELSLKNFKDVEARAGMSFDGFMDNFTFYCSSKDGGEIGFKSSFLDDSFSVGMALPAGNLLDPTIQVKFPVIKIDKEYKNIESCGQYWDVKFEGKIEIKASIRIDSFKRFLRDHDDFSRKLKQFTFGDDWSKYYDEDNRRIDPNQFDISNKTRDFIQTPSLHQATSNSTNITLWDTTEKVTVNLAVIAGFTLAGILLTAALPEGPGEVFDVYAAERDGEAGYEIGNAVSAYAGTSEGQSFIECIKRVFIKTTENIGKNYNYGLGY
ncbi:MAG TPA: hypothetical protein QF753_16665 [Victivallales bacterium]|nr:hypothetical protein [Victivallales bacterium]